MGYAVFASRKLMLTNSINMLQLQLNQLMDKQSDLTELAAAIGDGDVTGMDIANCQKYGLATEYGIDLASTKFTKYGDASYHAGLADVEASSRSGSKKSWIANLGGAGLGAAAGAILGFGVPGAIIGGILGGIVGNGISKKTEARNEQVEEYKKQFEEQKRKEMVRKIQEDIAAMENELQKRKVTLETKISAYQTDLQSTKEAEAQGIQNSAPKYAGLGQ